MSRNPITRLEAEQRLRYWAERAAAEDGIGGLDYFILSAAADLCKHAPDYDFNARFGKHANIHRQT